MPVMCKDILKVIENKYPLSLAEDYDNVGLIIGDPERVVSKVLVCLDINDNTVMEALENQVEMIIAHHPIIFKPIKRIIKNDYTSSLIMKLIKENINVYSLHTNFDNSIDGMSDIIARKLELNSVKPLVDDKPIKLFKLAVYVPKSHENIVRKAILDCGAGYIGNYSHCSFNIEGVGTFMPHEGSSPFIGSQGKLEEVNEVRIETIVKENDLSRIIEVMLDAHPYEEVAYDVYPVMNTIPNGSGRYGLLGEEMNFRSLCSFVKERLNIPCVNAAGDMEKKIQKVAVIGGSGEDFINEALKRNCDVIVTGDIRHHYALDAVASGINIIDGGHYFTEIVALPYIAQFISCSIGVECFVTQINTNPFQKV
jgi:dinuclear metal center YbgI/SA1388 family protein